MCKIFLEKKRKKRKKVGILPKICYNKTGSTWRRVGVPTLSYYLGGFMDIEGKVRELITKPVEMAGYFVDEVLYEKEGQMNFLRIIIDKNGTIDVDDCVTVSKIINPLLDEKDFIEESYILDVCSKEKGCE